jgi:hypothetical protein
MFKKLAVAFSLANLCFFQTWRQVLSPEANAYLYLWKQYPGTAAIVAITTNVLTLTALFYLAFVLSWPRANQFWRKVIALLFVMIFLRGLNSVRIQFQSLTTAHLRLVFGKTGFFVLGMTLLVLLLLAMMRYGIIPFARALATFALILAPFGLFALAQGTALLIKYYPLVSREQASVPLLPANLNPRPRVVWIIFDEFSEDLPFRRRPDTLAMPEFDRLQNVALSATNAFPPAARTLQSIPALLTGRLVAEAKPAGPDELLLTFAGETGAVGWSKQPDIFSGTRTAGLNAAVVGWYHPYCRVIGNRLTKCFWQPASENTDPAKLSVARTILLQDGQLLQLLPFTTRAREWIAQTNPHYRSLHLADYLILTDRAAQTAADPDLNLAFIHLPVPHPPNIYDRRRNALDTTGDAGYLDNLALADRTLGQIRTAMERNGTWENSTVVVSSDHWWRTEYWNTRSIWSAAEDVYRDEGKFHHIPFIVKLNGQKERLTYDAPFNTVVSHDLILDILSGKLAVANQVPAWLEAHRGIGESPYQNYDDPH